MCNSTLDVIFILDGSIGQDDFEKEKQFIGNLMNSLPLGTGRGQVQVGAILASGPSSLLEYQTCTGGTGTDTTCNVDTISPMSTDSEQIGSAIQAVSWPGETAYMAGAISIAQNMLQQNRQDAQSLVVVFSHGENAGWKILSNSRTKAAADSLMQTTRLMWVLIGGNSPSTETVKNWASMPTRDNILVAQDFDQLEEEVSDLVTTMCPVIAV